MIANEAGLRRDHLTKYCTFHDNTTEEVIDLIINNCKEHGSDGVLGHRTSLPLTSATGKWWKKLKGTKEGQATQKNAIFHLVDRQQHEKSIHSSIPRYWDRLSAGSDAIEKFRGEHFEKLDSDMKELLRTDLKEKESLLYYFALAPVESKIEKSTWDDRWISLEALTKKSIEESLRKMLRKPMDLEVEVENDSTSDDGISPPEIPKQNEFVIWNLSSLAREDVIASIATDKIAIFNAMTLEVPQARSDLKSICNNYGVVLACNGAEQERVVKRFKSELEMDRSEKQSTITVPAVNISESDDEDDDDVPLVEAIRRKRSQRGGKNKRKAQLVNEEEPRKKSKPSRGSK